MTMTTNPTNPSASEVIRRIEARGNTVVALYLGSEAYIVLAGVPGPQGYATWVANLQGDTFSGHYFDTLAAAEADFLMRQGRGY